MIGKFVGYIRVSTAGQAEDGYGLEIQEAAVRERIGETHKGVRIHRDEGVSGALIDRPGLSGALRALEKGDVFIVPRLDRLARDLISQELLLREIKSKGARLWSCTPGEQEFVEDDPADPSRRFIRQILGAVAEYEKALIALRLDGGRKAKRAKGGFAGGEYPYGYTGDGSGRLFPRRDEQAVLRAIRHDRAAGYTFVEVAARLNERGMRNREGRKWIKSAVQLHAKPQKLPVIDEAVASA